MSATINQPYIFMAIVYGGLVIGIIYGIFRAIAAKRGTKRASIVCDCFFFALTLPLLLFIFYAANLADMRFYSFIGIFGGVCMYYFGLGRLLRNKRRH